MLGSGEKTEPRRAVVREQVDIGCQRFELRRQGIERERGIRYPPAEIGILVELLAGAQRTAARHGFDGELERAVGDARVDRADEQQKVGEDAEDKRVATRANRQDAGDPPGGNDRALQHGGVALCRTHPQRIPVIFAVPARRLAGDEAMHQLVTVAAENAQPGPGRPEFRRRTLCRPPSRSTLNNNFIRSFQGSDYLDFKTSPLEPLSDLVQNLRARHRDSRRNRSGVDQYRHWRVKHVSVNVDGRISHHDTNPRA